jgi:hypothetical protein
VRLCRLGSVHGALIGLALLLVLLLPAASASAAEQRALKEQTGVEFSEVVALAEGNQCPSFASAPAGTIEWGDGLSSPATSFVAVAGGGAWGVSGKHAYAKPGAYDGDFTGSYKCNGSEAHFASVAFTAEVTTTIRTAPGVQFSGELAAVKLESTEGTDCTGDGHEATGTIAWGDGQTSALSGSEFVTEGELALRLSGAHTYTTAGHYEGTITGSYKCLSNTKQSYKAKFSAAVEAASPPPTGPPPVAPPPTAPSPTAPQVHAAFAIQSVTPGRAVLDAAASVPAGGSATLYSWNVSGGTQPDAVCRGSEPILTVASGGALSTTVSLTATDATTGASTVATLPLSIPAPLLTTHTGHASTAIRGRAAPKATARLPVAVTPTFKVIGTCTGAGVPLSLKSTYKGALALGGALISNVGGAPPAACLEDTQFGSADIEGCLGEVADINEIPGGVTLGLAKLLCGAKLESFCMPALSSEVGHAVSSFGDAIGARAARVGDSGLSAREALNVPAAAGLVEKTLAKSNLPFYFSTGAIRINGLDIDPQAGFPIVIIPAADTVVALDARVYLHGVPLTVVPALVLHLPEVGGHLGELQLPKKVPVIGTLPFEGSISIDLHRAGTKLSNGDTCQYDCAAVSVHLGLPGVFTNSNGEGLTAGAVLTADDQQGLELDSFEFDIPHADLGGVGVSDVEFRYLRGSESFHGGAQLELGPIGAIGATVDFLHGHFNGATLEYNAGVGTGIDLGGPIPIFLTRLFGGVTLEPATIEAAGSIAGGPQTLGCSLFGVDANVVVVFEPEFELNANGTGQLLCQSVASEYFHLDGGGHIGLGGTVHLHFLVFSIEGGVDFDVDTAQGHFQADANMSACLSLFSQEFCLGAEAVVSDRGIGVCADLGFTHAGGGIQFPDTPIIFFDTCDIGKFRSLGYKTDLHARGATASSFTVPRGEKVAVIGVPGSGAAPKVTLKGPSGRTIATPAAGYVKTADDVVIEDNTETKETYFFINHPEAGAWTATPEPGSAPVTSIQQASSLPAPDVKGRLARAQGGRERLRYGLRAIPGQQVAFAERQANGNFRVIGRARGAHGTLTFTPSAELGAKRTIEAMVSQDGHPREDAVIARFNVGARILPAPQGLKIKRRRGTLSIGFRRVAGARGYGVAVQLSDGRSLFLRLLAGRHAVSVPAVPANLGVRVEVGALAPGARIRTGRHAKARLKAGAPAARTRVDLDRG